MMMVVVEREKERNADREDLDRHKGMHCLLGALRHWRHCFIACVGTIAPQKFPFTVVFDTSAAYM